MGRLVVVSNRIASANDAKPGGLALAMLAALREHGGTWFGWSGRLVDDDPGFHEERIGAVTYATLDLTHEQHAAYYAGFSNRTLWPLFHFRPSLVDFSREAWEGYVAVNETFATHLARFVQPDDVVWVHDYHLIPLATHLRRAGVTARIGFFLHTPFPPGDLVAMLPVHDQLLRQLADYDVVGFQTERYLRAFREYARHELGARITDDGITLANGERTFVARAFPIGIEVDEVRRMAASAVALPACRRLADSLRGRELVVGVDRLDYSKGLPERLRAFQHLLREHRDRLGKVVLLQIAPASRTEVPEYRELRRDIERIAGSINGRFADPEWMPVRYVNKSYQHATLTGFYRQARVGLVTPLRDGMNLVAKEYVASQDPEDPGVLVLSRFAGAAAQMDSALLVNPYDVEATGDTLAAALRMPLAERRARWLALMDGIEREDIGWWRDEFLDALREAPAPREANARAAPRAEPPSLAGTAG
ncbi:MAG TPA: alpha,alpha-trehalose-phosphate synthase (UDP-forming) [Xanthomonadales bacterium]|nr:alpha,alpha-trehalose-phosphate synthase (UDP-forming) [Xanthomonadales bacterium]